MTIERQPPEISIQPGLVTDDYPDKTEWEDHYVVLFKCENDRTKHSGAWVSTLIHDYIQYAFESECYKWQIFETCGDLIDYCEKCPKTDEDGSIYLDCQLKQAVQGTFMHFSWQRMDEWRVVTAKPYREIPHFNEEVFKRFMVQLDIILLDFSIALNEILHVEHKIYTPAGQIKRKREE